MLAIWMTLVLTVSALATAMTLGWRRSVAAPAKQQHHEIGGTTCYPRVRR